MDVRWIRLGPAVVILGTAGCAGLGQEGPSREPRYQVDEGGALVVQPARGLLARAPESAFAVLVEEPKHASRFTLRPDGSFRYVHDGTESASDGFVYAVRDGSDSSSYAQRAWVDVRLINDAPVVGDVSLNTAPGEAVSGRVPAADPEAAELRFDAEAPQWGTLQLSARTGDFTYEPPPGFAGTDRFRVTVEDTKGGRADAEVTVQVAGVIPVPPPSAEANRPPDVGDVRLKTAEERRVQAPIAATDPDGDSLSYSVEPPEHGVAGVGKDGVVEYLPVPEFSGEDRFEVTVTDARGETAELAVFVEVSAVNDPPRAIDARLDATAGGSVESRFEADDPDDEALRFEIIDSGNIGSAELVSGGEREGRFTYSVPADASGTDRIVFRVTDGKAYSDGEISVRISPPGAR